MRWFRVLRLGVLQGERLSSSDHHDTLRASVPNPRVTRRPSYEAGRTDKHLMHPGKQSRRYTEINPRVASVITDISEDADRRRMSYGDQPSRRESIVVDRGTAFEKSDVVRANSREPRFESKNTNPKGESVTRQSIRRPSVNEDDLRRRISMI